MRRKLLALLLLAFAAPSATAGAATAIEEVMRGFADRRESSAGFVEEKAIPELDLPLRSRGTLLWQAPDRLEKRTTDPIGERLAVQGDRLVLERPGQGLRQELSLDQSPEIRPLVEAIRSTLAGDLPTLRRHYEVEFSGVPEGWRMVLTPLSARVRAAVQRIAISGQDAEIRLVETQSGSATTRMWIEPRS